MALSSPNRRHISVLKPSEDFAILSRVRNGYCSAMKRLSVSASMRRSSSSSKFMAVSSQSEDHRGNNVLLDLVRAAEDGQLAIVEVLPGCAGRVFGSHVR